MCVNVTRVASRAGVLADIGYLTASRVPVASRGLRTTTSESFSLERLMPNSHGEIVFTISQLGLYSCGQKVVVELTCSEEHRSCEIASKLGACDSDFRWIAPSQRRFLPSDAVCKYICFTPMSVVSRKVSNMAMAHKQRSL